MSPNQGMPPEAAIAVNDLLDNCAEIQEGQQVLIVAATDGLYGGINIVDRETVSWIQAAVQQRGANPSVLWLDIPVRPNVLWPNTPNQESVWRVPPVLREALAGADVFINHVVDLSFEEELKELPEIMREHNVPMVRNMATTAPMFTSAWAITPYKLVCELRYQTAVLIQPGLRWSMTHSNGTHLEGTINEQTAGNPYGARRSVGLYRPFPEGVFPALVTTDTEGTLVFERTGPLWARHIGIPAAFRQPVRLSVEKGLVKAYDGGEEARTIQRFYEAMSRIMGDSAYQIRGVHGGIHPHANMSEHLCPDPHYREFIEHHGWSSIHVHLGNGRPAADFPFNLHVSAEMRGASLRVGDRFLFEDGRLAAMDHPEVKAIAARYPGLPGLEPELWQ